MYLHCIRCHVNRSMGRSTKTIRREHMTHNISDTYRPSLLKYPTYDKEGWPLNPHKSLIHKGRKRKLKRQDHYRKFDQKQAREDLKWQKEQDRIERERQRSQEDWYY